MILRAGTGKVKHLSTKQLWVQSVAETFPLEVHKIQRSEKFSDMLTHTLSERDAKGQLKRMGFTCVA